MATQTTHFDLTKQQSNERVSVGLLNDNFDIIDSTMYANQEKSEQLAEEYNASSTYNTGDYVRRENYIYKCKQDNVTGTWDSTKWDRVKVMDEITQGGGGGSSTLAGLNDVSLATPTDGQLLGYNGTSHKWENVNGGGGGSSTFAGLNDVNVQGVSNGDIARYNSATGKWTDSSDLSDLELTVAQLQASVLSITDGHTILDSNGTAMAQEDGLQFASGCVEDDPVSGKTIYIEMIRISQANYNTLKANGQLKPGAKYFIYDAQPVAVNASNLPYSSTQSVKEAIDEQPLDISSSFVLNTAEFSDLDGSCAAFYDKKTKRVWGNLCAYSTTSTLSQTQAYFKISNTAYRPSSTKKFSGIIRTASNILFYQCDIGSDGRIMQKLTGTSSGIYGSFEYYL